MSEEYRNGISDEEAAEQARKYADKISEEDVGDMLGKDEKMKGFFRHVGVLKKYWQDVCDIVAMLKDRATGKYKEMPWAVIAALVGALVYVFSPIDLIPDFIPGLGYMDDAGVFAVALSFAGPALMRYRAWKREQEGIIDAELCDSDKQS